MTSLAPWARALGMPSEGVGRVVIDVRAGALPVVMVEALPGTAAARALLGCVGELDAGVTVRPLDAPTRETVEAILADMTDDAESLAMGGDKGRAEYAGHYAARLRRALEES